MTTTLGLSEVPDLPQSPPPRTFHFVITTSHPTSIWERASNPRMPPFPVAIDDDVFLSSSSPSSTAPSSSDSECEGDRDTEFIIKGKRSGAESERRKRVYICHRGRAHHLRPYPTPCSPLSEISNDGTTEPSTPLGGVTRADDHSQQQCRGARQLVMTEPMSLAPDLVTVELGKSRRMQDTGTEAQVGPITRGRKRKVDEEIRQERR
ncbi:hypothetical protein BCR39DRAFT_561751 [Naematelia encephala]|uniref:Uncharacterized protein n=1 Tax=Naematelia encephala TaxID=71784 RepID=A0A1Y2AND1_9TREE|nr:hypothetical protein BCR39DRAFT_561751 [Naematelia encephala]